MATLIPVQYHRAKYPKDINPHIREVAGNFDSKVVSLSGEYSLHTEYSFAARKFDSNHVRKYKEICESNYKGVPKLWFSEKWSLEFAGFIKDITEGNRAPKVIEIHPPFSDYSNLELFMENYSAFSEIVKLYFPNTIVLIENRSGSRYSGGRFIISEINEIIALSNEIDKLGSELRIALDLPQLFTAHSISKNKSELMIELFSKMVDIRHNILGVHLWGKRDNESGRRVAHIGNLNDYFYGDHEFKNLFLKLMHDTFDDNISRYFVPEINSGTDDLVSVVNDLRETGFKFDNFEQPRSY